MSQTPDIRQFMKALGGPTAVAKELSARSGEPISRPRVAMWGSVGNIPYRWRSEVVRLAMDKGVAIPPDVKDGVIVEVAP